MKTPELKPLLAERLKSLMPDEKDFMSFLEILKKPTQNSIRCNTLKISPEDLLKRLMDKGWIVEQPFKEYPEIFIINGKIADDKTDDNIDKFRKKGSNIKASLGWEGGGKLIELAPGELGRALEHLLGYYYVQEIASMLPALALKAKPGERVLDLCAAPGSKTTQMASEMKNSGLLIANDVSLGRIGILATNLERCGVSNTIITRNQGFMLCKKLKQQGFLFDKILLDAPCSGEGTLRSSKATYAMWNIQSVKNLSNIQKALLASAIDLLKKDGELVYSTCTHSPEENEEVLNFVLKKFPNKLKIETIKLPVKCRHGLTGWAGGMYDKDVEKSCRIYPHDNDTEGFFVAKLRRVK
ncbi:MAG: RsmB/NOP family class I SAM-dependent RNA methyltransferase [Nanoarchaeota archaeon]